MNRSHSVVIFPQFHETLMDMEDNKRCEETYSILFKENINLINLLNENKGEPIPVILNPLLFCFISTDEFKTAADSFLHSMLRGEQAEKEKWIHIYSQWMKWNKDLTAAYKNLLENGKALFIPTSVNSLPLTHYRTSKGLEIQVKASIECFKRYMEDSPTLFWLPQAAYLPGLDLYLLAEGIEASFISSFSYTFSEKEEEAEVVRSPRGLKLIPVIDRDRVERWNNDDSGIELLPLKLDENELESYEEFSPSSIRRLLNAPSTLARIGFGYLGMEYQGPILEDEAMKNMRKVHEMEDTLEKISSYVDKNSPGFRQLVREFISALQGLNENRLDTSHFGRIATLMLEGAEDDHFIHHRNNVNSIFTDDLVDACHLVKGDALSSGVQEGAVLILSWEYPPNIVGGLSRHVYDLANNLVRKGKKVHVLTARSNDAPPYETVEGVTIHRVHPLHPYEENFFKWVFDLNQSFIQYVHELISQEKITHIHAHDWIVSTSAIKLKEYYSLPLITTIHATEHGRNQGINTELQQKIHNEEQLLVAASDHLIVCSEHMKEEVQSLFTFSAPLEVIPNGVELERLEQLTGNHIVQEHIPYFFSIGRMVHEKGFETLIRAASLLKDEGQKVSFIIAGKGPMLEHYRQQVKHEGLEDMVVFTGFISDEKRNSYLKSCLAVIFPSLYEPFGIVALEAMAFKKAVVASDTGGLKSIVKHEHTGLLFQPEDESNLYSHLQSLLKEPDKSRRLGEVGFKMAQSMFSWERIADQTIHVYEDVLLQAKVEGLR
jgi:1,4-alpha-glucan branching enzyme